jgi:hypothetical protein
MRIPARAAPFCMLATLALSACSEDRLDPCDYVSVAEASALDSAVSSSLWAGRGAEKSDNEVCLFYTAEGDPRLMVFVWYDNNVDMRQLVADGSKDDSTTVELTDGSLRGAATFGDGELQLLAVQSARRTVGFRWRQPVRRNSPEFDNLLRLARTAAQR